MVGQAPIGKDAGVDPRMERLDPSVEHLREPGDSGDVGDGQARLAKRPRGARRSRRARTRARTSPPAKATRPVLSETDRRARRGVGTDTSARAASTVTRRPSSPTVTAPGQHEPHGPRQQPVLDRADPFVQSFRRRRRAARRPLPGPRSVRRRGSASTTWIVQPVTVTPCARASATAWAPGNAGSSDGCVLRIRPGNAASTSGPTIRMYPASTTTSASTADSVAASVASSPPGTSAVSIPCSIAHSSGGACPVGEDEDDRATDLTARDRGRQGAQVRPGARHADRDPSRFAHQVDTGRGHATVSSAPST